MGRHPLEMLAAKFILRTRFRCLICDKIHPNGIAL